MYQIDDANIVDGKDERMALAILLADDVVFINLCDTRYPFNVNAKEPIWTTCVYVNANDVFMWGCADAECIETNDGEDGSEIISLYKLHIQNKKWGSIKWCCLKRNLQPQPPIKIDMIKDGYWDETLEKLQLNPSDPKYKKHDKAIL